MLIDAFKRVLAFLMLLLAAVALGTVLSGPAMAQDADECLQCHEDQDLTKNVDGKVVSLYVDIDKFDGSIHGEAGITCVDCHADLQGFEDWPHPEQLADVDCAQCHERIGQIYKNSLHGQMVAQGEKLAPRCWSCHGAHDIRPPSDPTSTVNRFNIPMMCGRCHKEGSPVADFSDIEQDSILTHYKMSIHGEGLYKRGLTMAAVCSDCHTAHDVRDSHDPRRPSPASAWPRPASSATAASRTCTRRSSRAGSGRASPTRCPSASSATSPTRSAASTTTRA